MSPSSPAKIGAERIMSLPTYEASETVSRAATNWVKDKDTVEWQPICDDKNNRGHVEIVETDVQGLVELLTNSSDAYLVQYTDEVESREELLDTLDEEEVLVEFTGDSSGGSENEYSVIVADEGCGVSRSQFEDAFLKDPSTGGVDKRKYQYLYGEFGQGSLASIGVSKKGCKFVASASKEDPKKWSWSVTRYNDERKRYEYLTVNGEVPKFNGKIRVNDFGRMSFGTITKVFNIDSTQTPRDVTSNPFIRRLGHAFPETAVPLNIIDNREGQHGRRRVWSGMKEELNTDPNVEKLSTTKNLGQFGEVNVEAFVVDEEESFDNEFLNSQTRDRIFYTVYGMTHHTQSYNKLKNDCDLKGIGEDVMVFVDCSKLSTPINDIFLPSRTGMKQGKKSQSFVSEVHNVIENWDDIQNIDEERASLADILDTDGETPLNGMSFVGKDSPVPTFEADDNLSVQVEVESDVEEYCCWEHIDVEVMGLHGKSQVNIDGDTVELDMSVVDDSRVTLCIKDTEFNDSITSTFAIECESEEPRMKTGVTTLGETQSGRATRGNDFESKVVNKLSNKTDFEVSLESQTPQKVVDELWFDVEGVDIKPDTDVIIHDGEEPKGVVSCKRSLRERVGQTAFWKLFLEDEGVDIPIYLATLDPDNELNEGRKWRAIAERILDGVVVFGDDKEYFNEQILDVDALEKLKSITST